MNDDLISRSAFLKRMMRTARYFYVKFDIMEEPAVDAAEVVRCKDCNHWRKDVIGCTDFVGYCGLAKYMVGATGYCVYGERKEGAYNEP